ncbi:MAG TPA: RDD family protein [Sulfurimonas sp.]|nr:RDD family protein [Sulfurimonas sp.]
MARHKDIKKNQKNSQKANDSILYAGFWSRFLSLSVDVFMIGIPISILIYFTFGYETMQNQPGFIDALEGVKPSNQANPFIPLLTMSLWSLITLSFWISTGQTPGKKMANIQVVDNITFTKANPVKLLVRLLFFIMPIFTLFSLIIMLFDSKKRTVHDILSGTCVIYKH